MNAPAHWARVKLVSGNSGAAMWDLSSALPEARVTVGSGTDAGWNVQAQGVAPVHFELYWDGKALWVGPPMAGTLTVDGQPVQAWRQLSGQCRVQFGGGTMAIETSGAQPQVPQHAAAPAQPLTSQAALPIGSLDDFADDDATAIYEEGMVPPLLDDGPAAPTPMGVVAPAAAAAGFAAPRLGTGVPQAPGRAAPPTVGFQMDDVTSKPDFGGPPRVEFKTQVLDTSAMGDLPPPAAGAQAAPPLAGPGAGAPVDQRPTLMQSSVATDIIPKDGGAEERVHVGPGGGAFALPPIPSALPDDGKKKKGLERPPQRTMILFAITLLVALGALTLQAIQKKRLRAAAEAEAVAEQERQAQEAQTIADNLRQQIRADRARVAQQQIAERERIMGVLAEPLEAAREKALDDVGRRASEEERAAAVREAERKLIERKAVEAAMTNQLVDALALYELLASDYPDPAYSATAAAIRAKVECRRRVRRNGTECTP